MRRPSSTRDAVSQDRAILDNHRSTLVNLDIAARIGRPAGSSDGKPLREMDGGQGGNRTPTVERRLIYSQRSSPPAQPTHEIDRRVVPVGLRKVYPKARPILKRHSVGEGERLASSTPMDRADLVPTDGVARGAEGVSRTHNLRFKKALLCH